MLSREIHLLLSNFHAESPLPPLLSLASASTSTKVTVSAVLEADVLTVLASVTASDKNRFLTSGTVTASASRLTSCLLSSVLRSLVAVLRRCLLTSALASTGPWGSLVPDDLFLFPEPTGEYFTKTREMQLTVQLEAKTEFVWGKETHALLFTKILPHA